MAQAGVLIMVKKLRQQENRNPHTRRRRPLRDIWVFEPIDAALLAVIAAVALWLQWLMAALPG